MLTKQPKRPNEFFCPLPFLQLTLYPTGDVSPCCRLPLQSLGNIKDQSLESCWNGEQLKDLRREFLTGQIKTCRRAIRETGCHLWHEHLLDSVDLVEHQGAPIRKLDVRLNGRCNLECVMCEVWQQPNGVYDRTDFWVTGPTQIFPHLLEIEVLGGEPFIQKDTFRLIDAVSSVNANAVWLFTTNAHWKLTAVMKERLDRIRIRRIIVSLDSFEPDTYELIRKRGKLERVLLTLQELRIYRDERARRFFGFELTVCMLVQQGNVDEVESFIERVRSLGLTISFIFLYGPRERSLSTLPHKQRQAVLAGLKAVQRRTDEPQLTTVIEALAATLEPERLLENVAEELRLMDRASKQDLR